MKKWLSYQLLIIIIVFVMGQICKANFIDHGLYKMKTIEDGYLLKCGVEYILEKKDLDGFIDYQNSYIESSEEYPIVVIGKPTGNIEQALRSFGQEIIVEKILKGTGIEKENKYFVYKEYGFNITSGNELSLSDTMNVINIFNENNGNRLVYGDTTNVMNPDCYYLIFLKPSDLNPLTSIDSYMCLNYFPYLNISRDRSFPINEDLYSIKYADLKDSEFFASNQEIIDQVHIIKHKIVSKYKDEIGDYLGMDLE